MGDFFMKKDFEFLDHIYKNAEMGIIGIDHILDKIDDIKLKKLIKTQREEYSHILEEALKIYKQYGRDEKELGKMAKISSELMAEVTLLKSKEKNSAIAKMMIEGSNKGIIELNENLNKFKNIDAKIVKLAHKLLATEEHNLNELKKYL